MYQDQLISLIPQDFDNNSKVWIFQSSRRFTKQQQQEIDEQLHQFYAHWTSHGAPVKGWASLLFEQFIVVMADENSCHVGGCSTDSMMHIIKSIERQYDTHLFDRLTLTFLVNNGAQMLPLSQVQHAIDQGHLTRETLLFNNTVTTKAELINHWLIPISESWLSAKLQFV